MFYTVKRIPLEWIPMQDGTKLAAKLWIPEPINKTDLPAEEGKYPAVLEFLPYRRIDWTAARDEKNHSYFCSYGYVCVRVDMRGSGDSEGFYYDEYEKQEQDDCCDVIDWISQQPWCTGNVGMYGKSWGGFNGLQVAARRPCALKTIISTYSTDDRYADDIHYRGGCVLGREMLSWAHIMFLWNARPPHPDSLGPRWKQMWLDRLNKSSEPWIHIWLSHQSRDAYWKHGSIAEDYTSIKCPVFLIGGYSDLYTDAVFRMVEHLNCPVRALIGPWSHAWPADSSPGPRIDHLKECVRWWDCHLKGLSTDVMKEPLIRMFLRDGISMAHKEDIWPGRWVAEDCWPSPNVQLQEFILHNDQRLALTTENYEQATVQESVESNVFVKSSFLSGSWGGLPLAFSLDELPIEQGFEDNLSECWETVTLNKPTAIVGFPEVHLQLSSDRPCALVAARLCDVFPNGESALITRGVLNLTHISGHSSEDIQPLQSNKNYHAQLKLDSTAYTVAAGHKLRLSLSSVHWPYVWPSPQVSCLSIQTGSRSKLVIPIRTANQEVSEKDAQLKDFELPDYKHINFPVEWQRMPHKGRDLEIGQLSDNYKLTVTLDDGCYNLKDTNTTYDEINTETFTIKERDPSSAKVHIQGQVMMKKEGHTAEQEDSGHTRWDTRVQASSEMWCDEQFFHLKSQLTAWHCNEECFDKTWTKKIERFYV